MTDTLYYVIPWAIGGGSPFVLGFGLRHIDVDLSKGGKIGKSRPNGNCVGVKYLCPSLTEQYF